MSRPDPNYIPKLTHNRASGKAVVRLSGVDIYCGRWGTAEAQSRYDREVAEWLARGRTPKQVRGAVTEGSVESLHEKRADAVAVNTVLLAFWKHAENYYRDPNGKPTSQLSTYRQTIRVVRSMYGLEPVEKFGPLALRAVRQRLVSDGLARSEVNRRVSLVRKIFKWSASEEMIAFDVYHRLTSVTGLQKGRTAAAEDEPVNPIDEVHVHATIAYLNRQVAGLVRFIRFTGCRPGEACRLRCDVDRSGEVWLYKPHHHKNAHRGKSRVVPIGPKAQAALAEFAGVPAEEYVFSPRASVAARNAERSARRRTPRYLSHVERNTKKRKADPKRPAGKRYTTQAVDHAVARAVKCANRTRIEAAVDVEFHVVDWSPNQLRHTYATEVRKLKYGAEGAQVILGHERLNTTEIYAEKNLALAVRIAKRIG